MRNDFKVGDRVKWNDPAINDYDPNDREEVLNRVFIIEDISPEVILISEENGCTEAEVFINELEKID